MSNCSKQYMRCKIEPRPESVKKISAAEE